METTQAKPSELTTEIGEEEPKRLLGFIQAKNSSHSLKLRHSFTVNERLRAEVGYDYRVSGNIGSRPWGAIMFQLDPDREEEGFLEVNNDFITVNKKFDLKLRKLTVGVDAKLGVTTQGQPHIQVGIDNIPIVLAAAAVMLCLQKPISVSRKETGGLCLDLPLGGNGAPAYTLQERAELDCSLRRDGRCLLLDLHQVNGVIRLQKDGVMLK